MRNSTYRYLTLAEIGSNGVALLAREAVDNAALVGVACLNQLSNFRGDLLAFLWQHIIVQVSTVKAAQEPDKRNNTRANH